MNAMSSTWERFSSAPEMMLLALKTRGLDVSSMVRPGTSAGKTSSLDFAPSNATSPPPTSPIWNHFWGDMSCVKPSGAIKIFNSETAFLTTCFVTAVALGLTLTMLVPVLLRIRELLKVERAKPTLQGQMATLMALIAPLLILYTGDFHHAPPLVNIVVGSFGLIVAALSYIQDGRVLISVPEVLLYWLGGMFFYFGWAADAVLSTGITSAVPKILATVFAFGVFMLELTNSERHPRNSYDDTSIFSRISIAYTEKLMAKDSVITHDTLLDPPTDMNALVTNYELAAILDQYPATSKYRIVLALKDLLKGTLYKMVALAVVATLVMMSFPEVIGMFLSSLSRYSAGNAPIYEAYYLAILLGVIPIVNLSFDNMGVVTANYLENKARAGLLTVMYRKAMRLSPGAREKFDPAKIMNMISVDTQQVFMLGSQLPELVAMPLALVLSTWQLWQYVGPSFFSAILVYLIVIPFSTIMSALLGSWLPELMRLRDVRNKLTTNAFRCIKSLKLHAWEKPFYQRIADMRNKEELGFILKKIYVTLALTVMWNSSGDLVASAVFVTFLWLRMGTLTAEIVFPSLVLLQSASSSILIFPQALNTALLALNAQRRINELLIEEDHDHANYYRFPLDGPVGFEDSAIALEKATISWNGEDTDEKIAIKDLSFQATKGDLVCIVGRVGAGKSALCQALCGDLAVISGDVVVRGGMAYCSQEAWLQNYSVRENIIFGQPFDETWYNKVVDACELTADIEQMPLGDKTEVGERGISLSGGQKARVAIARAVYSRADVLVLDDVLSAVDEHVGGALIRKLFSSEGLLANRTVVLATNNVKVLSHSSLIIALEKKRVVETLSFKDVVSQGQASVVYRLIEEFGHADDLKQESHHIGDRKEIVFKRENADPYAFPANLREKPAEISALDVRTEGDRAEEEEGDNKKIDSLAVFKRYLVGDSMLTFLTWLVILGISTVLTNSAIVYMGFATSRDLDNLVDGCWYMVGYVLVTVSSGIGIWCAQGFILYKIGLRNSRDFHDSMLWNVFHAPMTFFDVTPVGRLINRFSGDISMLDEVMPTMFYYMIRSAVNTLTVIGGIIIGSPIVILAVIPLSWLANRSRAMYVPMQRKVVRISSAANSPILSLIEDSLKGQTSIRAFDHLNQYIDMFDQRVDYWSKAAFYSANLTQWLGFRIQALTTGLLLASALAVTHLVSLGYLTTGYAAVILNFAQRAGVMVRQTILFLAQAETSSVSLERLMEYIDIKQEAAAVIEATKPEPAWPEHGEVTFKNLSAKYTEDGPKVLNDLSFTIKGGEKIGIVGRTGSGKSTLTLAIFRILEACEGHVEMDGIDTSILGLFDLRSRLSIIPQDAQIFDSTVRENLDPLRTTDDAKLWEVLDLCKLKDHFAATNGLDTELTDSGSNLSRGQAQLLCLGRALVHKSKVLVLDEATASVDQETDKLVQETIRKNFSDRTIITIAHRLNTIMDSDRIIVLDKGVIREFDSPENLLNARGLFYSLRNTEKREQLELEQTC